MGPERDDENPHGGQEPEPKLSISGLKCLASNQSLFIFDENNDVTLDTSGISVFLTLPR
jgi:hypothetical protein